MRDSSKNSLNQVKSIDDLIQLQMKPKNKYEAQLILIKSSVCIKIISSKIIKTKMFSKLLKRQFTTAVQKDLLSTKNMKKFLVGDFPAALQHSRPFKMTTTSNGIMVASELMASNISSISVFIKCGSRDETESSSGTAHFLEHLHFKGTKNRSRNQLELQVQNMGGNLNAYTSRENTCYMMTSFNQDLSKSVEIIGDMITNSLYREKDIENQRSTIHRQLLQTQKSQPLQTTLEIAHRGIYKNHQMGLPILGYIHNMQTISKQMIQEYHNENYVGENIIVCAAGNIDHETLHQACERYIAVPKNKSKQTKLIKPQFNSGVSALQSHLTPMVNMVTVHEAPSFFDNEFFCYLLLQRIISDRPDTELELEIMKNSTSFKFQKHLSSYEFIDKQKGFYSSYWDTGMYGNYFHCEPEKVLDVIKLSNQGYGLYANKVTDEELERAKRRVYVQILQHETQNDLTQALGNNLMYYGRRVTTKELSERVASITNQQIQKVAQKIIKNQEKMHVCLWGNVKKVPFLQQK